LKNAQGKIGTIRTLMTNKKKFQIPNSKRVK
jgi:hypothetical protein